MLRLVTRSTRRTVASVVDSMVEVAADTFAILYEHHHTQPEVSPVVMLSVARCVGLAVPVRMRRRQSAVVVVVVVVEEGGLT